MSDLRSSNIYDMLDEDGVAAPVPGKKDAKSASSDKPSNKKVDAPAKNQKPAKPEDPAAPLGKEQRGAGGRDQKPRGRGRDNKGGLRKAEGSGREFDRRSGPSATHRNPREGKRNDRGTHNWGNAKEESTIAATATEDATPTSPPPPADENKTETPVEAKDAEQKEETKPEEVDNNITYDQFLKQKEAKAPADDKLEARAVENDESQWVAAAPLQSEKKKKKTSEAEDKDAEEKAEKGGKKKKNIVSLDQFVAAGPSRPPARERDSSQSTGERGGRGGRGRGAPRGASRGRGGRGGRGGGGGGAAPALDESAFPKLGK
jgi:hypothetical protein